MQNQALDPFLNLKHYAIVSFMKRPINKAYLSYLDSAARAKSIYFFLVVVEKVVTPVSFLLRRSGFEIIFPLSGIKANVADNKSEVYEEYRTRQTKTNKKKLARVFASEENLKFISEFLLNRFGDVPLKVICHGSRNGFEQAKFSELLPGGSEILGTDISPTATMFPATIQWDFNERNPEWEGIFDVVYSNSHDHAFNLRNTLATWIQTLNNGGVIILEHSIAHEWVKKSEPSAVKAELIPFLILDWFQGEVLVTAVLRPPHYVISSNRHNVIVISKQKS